MIIYMKMMDLHRSRKIAKKTMINFFNKTLFGQKIVIFIIIMIINNSNGSSSSNSSSNSSSSTS